jgi:UDP-N-acetyl-D-glucosamine dehydrogenase
MTAEFIELAGKVNQNMPYHCVARIERVLNDHAKPVRGSRIAIFGVSYKAGVGDMRESPALKIIEVLRGLGGEIVYHDPHVPSLPEFGLRSAGVDEALDGADMAVIVTAHPGVDHDSIVDRAPAALDLRGVTRRRARDRSTVQL